jgi:medium-chain acyl-[acyl-carrier-protein] hydrolase
VELPGRGTRLSEPCFSKLPPLVDALASGLESTLDLPFCFFGTSFGALIAFDLSQHLRRRGGSQPLKLFVAARQAPDLPDRNPLHHLGQHDFVAALRSYGGTSGEVLDDDNTQSILLPSLRADFTADETYAWIHGPPLRCPISAFGGREDWITTENELMAWSRHTQGSFRLRMLPGGHFFPFTRHGEQALLRAIMDDLDAHPLELGR